MLKDLMPLLISSLAALQAADSPKPGVNKDLAQIANEATGNRKETLVTPQLLQRCLELAQCPGRKALVHL